MDTQAVITKTGGFVPPVASLDDFTQHGSQDDLSNHTTCFAKNPEKDLNILQAALGYAKSGIPVFPCNPDKSPMLSGGFKSASCDYGTVEHRWRRSPNALIGMVTGNASGFFVLDIDCKGTVNGFDTLAALEERYGALPVTRTVKTPSGGEHRYFKMPETDPPLSCSTGKLGPGLDTRAEGGYVIAPPSMNSNGNAYQFVDRNVEPAPLPEWMIDLLTKPKKSWQVVLNADFINDNTPYGQAALDNIVAEMAATPEGQRNDTLFKLSCRLGSLVAGGELSRESAEQIKDAAAEAGLDTDEIEKTFASGFNAGMQSPATADDKKSGPVASVAVADVTEKNEWSEPQPLTPKIEAKDYPVDALPETIRAAVNEVTGFVKAPVAMVASSALGAVSLALQAHIDVERASGLKSPAGLRRPSP
jgi:hypothetical protein